MKKLICFLVLCTAVNYVTAKQSHCYGNLTIGSLPFTIQQQLIDIFLQSAPATFIDCSVVKVPITNDSIKFYYFNSTSSYIRIDPENPPQLDSSKRTIVLIHGWLCSMNDSRFPDLRQAYFQRYGDCNIIGVDWSDLSVNVWSIAYCSNPIVGRQLGDLLCQINNTSNITVESVHVIGHSMGAQIAGYAGQRVQTKCMSKIGIITGLDPGAISYQVVGKPKRLDPTDAKAVHGIHTNMGILGYQGPCGTTDFFPNCGTFQPGCMNVKQALQNASLIWPNNTQAILNNTVVNLPVTTFACDHFRSIDYFIESVNSKSFKAISCAGCILAPLLCVPDLWFRWLPLADFTIMGEYCPPVNREKLYYLTTNSESPYARGSTGTQ